MSAGTAKLKLLIDLQSNIKAGLNTAQRQVSQACGNMQERLSSLKQRNLDMFNTIKSEVPGVGRAVGLLANPYMAAAAGAAALGAAIAKTTKMANRWQEALAEVNVTAELSKEQLKGLSDELLAIGSRNVAPLEKVPKAFNRIISAGLSVEQSMSTLEPTLRAAKAGFTDIETVASAAVSVMMSSGEDANKVYDILFETVKEGNAEFKDIALYLPKVIPLARNVGFALDETAGAYASLSAKLSTEQSTTALQGVMRALSTQRTAIGDIDKATGQYVSGFKSIGVDVFDPATNKIRPMLDLIKDLKKQMEGLSDRERMEKFGKLGLDQMASIGFSTMMQDVEGLEKAIRATTDAQGALDKAYQDSLTPMEQWKIVQNQLKVVMIRIGNVVLPLLSWAGQKILDIIQWVKDLYNNNAALRDIIAVIGFNFKMMFRVVMVPIKAAINYFRLLWMGVARVSKAISDLIERATGIKTSVAGIYNYIRPYMIWIRRLVTDISGIIIDLFSLDFASLSDRISNFELPSISEIKQEIAIEETKKIKEVATSDKSADNPLPMDGNAFVSESMPGVMDDTSSASIAGVKNIKNGSETKNITINIDSFIKGFSPQHTAITQMDPESMERWLSDMFLRVIRSAELTV